MPVYMPEGLFDGARSIARNIPTYAMKYVAYPVAGFVLGVAVLGGVACGKSESYAKPPAIEQQATPTTTYPTATPSPVPTATYTPVPPTATPDPYTTRLNVATSALDPTVREYVLGQPWFQDGVDEREFLLLGFLGDANKSVGIDRRLPSVFVSGGMYRGFDSDRQKRVLENGLYDYVQLQKGEVLVVISSDDPQLQRSGAEGTISMAKRYLPQVDDFVGGRYPYNYLHVQIDNIIGGSNYSNGSSIFLLRGDARPTRAKSFSHEIVHSYQFSYPVWFKEGIADLIAISITGDNTPSCGTVPISKINLEYNQSSSDSRYCLEAGNGYRFLLDVINLIDHNNKSAIIKDIFTSTKTGQQILDMILKNTPDGKKDAVKGIFAKWVEGYSP